MTGKNSYKSFFQLDEWQKLSIKGLITGTVVNLGVSIYLVIADLLGKAVLFYTGGNSDDALIPAILSLLDRAEYVSWILFAATCIAVSLGIFIEVSLSSFVRMFRSIINFRKKIKKLKVAECPRTDCPYRTSKSKKADREI